MPINVYWKNSSLELKTEKFDKILRPISKVVPRPKIALTYRSFLLNINQEAFK